MNPGSEPGLPKWEAHDNYLQTKRQFFQHAIKTKPYKRGWELYFISTATYIFGWSNQSYLFMWTSNPLFHYLIHRVSVTSLDTVKVLIILKALFIKRKWALAALHGLWELSAPTWDWTQASNESVKPWLQVSSLNHWTARESENSLALLLLSEVMLRPTFFTSAITCHSYWCLMLKSGFKSRTYD